MRSALILILFLPLGLLGQDVHFSQYQLLPAFLNPATTGSADMADGKGRISTAYRNERSKVLSGDGRRVYAVSFDSRKDFTNNYFLGYGLSGVRERAGELSIGNNHGNLSLSLGKQFAKDSVVSHKLTIGGQMGIVERVVDPTNARWIIDDIGNPMLPIDGQPFVPSFLYLDFSTGLYWTSNFRKNRRFFLGAAVYHTNQPNVSFFPDNNEENLPIRFSLHGGGELQVGSDGVSVAPAFLYQKQGPHRELVLGSKLSYSKIQSFAISGGLFYRLGSSVYEGLRSDAMIVMGSIRIRQQYTLGVSYDYSLVRLSTINNINNALEIVLGYTVRKRADKESSL